MTNKTLLILRHEVVTTLRSKGFLFTAFALPLIAILIFAVISVVKNNQPETAGETDGASEMTELLVEGYVDPGGLVRQIPADIPAGTLIAYPDEASALQALDDGAITAYYLVPADYVASGGLVYVNPAYRLAAPNDQSWVMQTTLFHNLLGNDPERVARAGQPMEVQTTPLSPEAAGRDEDNPLTFFVPYGTMMAFYFVLLMAASLLLSSVNNEKKNRTIEVLLLSTSPRAMLTGKIVGLGLLGLLQTVIWVGCGYTVLRLAGRTLSVPAGLQLPPSIIGWGIVFFLLGYAIYASLMAGLGALVPNIKEASQSIILVIWPLILPLFFVVVLIENTHGALATAFSLFPLTAPLAMLTRLAVGGVPWWQPWLAAAGLLVTAVFIVRAVARLFRAQNLLSGQPFSPGRYLKALLQGAP